MTTNEAVEYIEEIIRMNLKQLETVPDHDKIVSTHRHKCEEALAIIKTDLAEGFRHYIHPDYPQYSRAMGLFTCDICKHTYMSHKQSEDYSWLTVLCNGELVKL